MEANVQELNGGITGSALQGTIELGLDQIPNGVVLLLGLAEGVLVALIVHTDALNLLVDAVNVK
jgi:hypothetical protein